jgi:putative PEP-CTERM system TPR-repeat lipoprotein
MRDRQYAKATQYFERAAALDPKNVTARIGLGMSRLAAGATDRAMADLEAASALGPAGARADVVLAMLSLKRKEYDQALQTVARLEKAEPGNPIVYNLKAAAYVGKGDLALARAQFDRALQADPTFFPAVANLALLDLQAGDVAAARRRYEAVLQKDKNQVQAMLGLADLAGRERGKEAEAQEWIKRAKAANAESRAPVQAEIDLYRRSGQLDKALAVAMEQRKLRAADPDALETLGKLLIAMGHTKDAVAVFADRTALLPNSAEAFYDLGNARMAAADPAGAADSLQRAVRLNPRYPEARALLVAAELAQDRAVRALTVAREVQNDMPKAPLGYVLEGDVLMATRKPAQATVLYEKAYGLHKSGFVATRIYDAWADAGKPDVGEARLKEWLAQDPSDIASRRHLAYGRIQRGKYAQAIEQYKFVLDKQPDDRLALNNVAWAMNKLKDPAAVRFAQRAYDLKPDDGAIADTYATILIDSGDLAKGLAILQKAVADAPGNREVRLHLAQTLAKSGDKAKAIGQLEIVLGSGTRFPQESEALALLKQLRQ